VSELYYIPKGSMCMNCKRKGENCSNYDFKSMPVIEKITGFGFSPLFIVRCTFYDREGK